MKIAIDIPDAYMKGPKIENGSLACKKVLDAVYSGTPLPKGHGDLVDRNELLRHYDQITYNNGIEERKLHFVQIGYVNDATAIIEADGGEE